MSKRKAAINEFTDKSIGKNALEIVTALALPEEMQKPIRFADQFACERTAVCIPWQEVKVNWTQAVSARGHALPAGTIMFFIFRDPLRRIVIYYPNDADQGYRYNWYFPQQVPSVGGVSTSAMLVAGKVYNTSPVYALVDAASTLTPHGTILYPLFDSSGDCANYSWMWCDAQGGAAAGQWVFQCSVDPTANGVFVLYKRVNGQRVYCTQIGTTATVLSYTVSNAYGSGYFAWDLTTQVNDNITVQYQCLGGSIWQQLCDTDMYSNMYATQAIRCLGCSFRFTNEASPLNQQGNIVEAQVGAQDTWENFLINGYAGLASYPNSKSRVAAKGTDGFLKPMQQQDFKFLMPFAISANNSMMEAYNDVNDCDFSYIAVACSTTNASGGDFILRVSPLNEYKTRNSWIPQSVPEHTTADWIEALEIFKSLEQFYDNPVHVRDILRTIGYWANVGGRWAKKVAAVAAYLAK